MTAQPPIAISAESLLTLPLNVLIALYNAESRRMAGTLDAHTVDSTCKPLYIVKLMAKLPIRYSMMKAEQSNEQASMSRQGVQEEAERKPSEAERAREAMPLNVGGAFNLMR